MVQPEGPDEGHSILLLIDPVHPQQLTGRSNRRWSRLAARLLATSLDSRLAQGRSSESNRLLAARAQALVSPTGRDELARGWRDLLVQVRRPAVGRDPHVRLNRDWVIACEPDIQAMVGALLAPLPIPARGAAMASWLLSDGAGPVFNRRCQGDLGAAVRDVIAELDATAPLVPREECHRDSEQLSTPVVDRS